MECKNCNSQLTLDSRYCSKCGNRTVSKRLTVKSVLSEFSNQFFNYDNRLLKTFAHLFTKPEVVIDKFIDGSRKTYVNVIGYLALSLTLIGFQIVLLRKFYPETMESSTTSGGLDPELERRIAELGPFIFDYLGLIMIIFIPITALATYLIFINKRHNYAEHIVLNLYVTAQYSIMAFFLGFFFMIFGMDAILSVSIISIIIYIYFGYCFKRLYNLTILGALWRTIVSQFIYSVIVSIILSALAIIGFIIYKLVA